MVLWALPGVVLLGPTAEVPLDEVKSGFAVNVFGLLDMCQVGTVWQAIQTFHAIDVGHGGMTLLREGD